MFFGFLDTPLKPVIFSGQFTHLTVLKGVGVTLSPVLKRSLVCVGPFIYRGTIVFPQYWNIAYALFLAFLLVRHSINCFDCVLVSCPLGVPDCV